MGAIVRRRAAIALLLIVLAAALPAAAAPPSAKTTLYRVQQGDTLYRISRRHNTTPERLAAMNGITVGGLLRIGQPLRVPVAPSPSRAVAAVPAQASPANAPGPAGPAAPGQTLFSSGPDSPDLDPALTQALLAPEPPPHRPAPEADAPAAPATPQVVAPAAPVAGPRRGRIAPLPSRGAQWMTAILALSTHHLGAPYRWGGSAPGGFDCSGFVRYVFDRTGIDLPRTTFAMFSTGTPVPAGQLQAGDVVFFQTISPGPSHAGVYLGDGRFIHASSGLGRVTITALTDPYYAARYLGARRF